MKKTTLRILGVIVVVTVSCLVPERTFAIQFQASQYPADSYPWAVAVGDFNRDGKLDMAVSACFGPASCTLPSVVVIFLGDGKGGFTMFNKFIAAPPYMTAQNLAIGDFNGDGILDLAVTNMGGFWGATVSILLGNGDGSFQAPVFYTAIGGKCPTSITSGDFNGDGHVDLAVVDACQDHVGIMLGNGDGTFQAAVDYPTEIGPQGIVAGDFNRDGKLDLAVSNQCGSVPGCASGTVSIMLGNGDGTFQQTSSYYVGVDNEQVVATDLNHDGKLDLVVANACGTDRTLCATGSVGVLLGHGDGSFSPVANFSTAGGLSVRVAVGDFNGDGIPDVVTTNYQTSNISVLLGSGGGAFMPAVTYDVGIDPISVAVADFNRDKASDIAVANEGSNSVSVFLNAGGTRVHLTSSPNPSMSGQAVTLVVSVIPSLQGYVTPTGSVTFKAGSMLLGTSELVNGSASVTTSTLPVGRDRITANYSGDGQYNPNTTSTWQVVKP